MKRVQMLGLCRFSYLGGRGFQVAHDTLVERRTFLYDAARLKRRWFWFENVTLPGLVAQTDADFTLVLMTGPDLPELYLSRLRMLCDSVPQFRLALIPPMEAHLDACRAAIAPHVDPDADIVGHFRQDDDDAVAIDFIQDARRDFADLRPLWKRRGRVSCDYTRGVVLKATGEGVEVLPRVIFNATAGLTIYLRAAAPRSAIHFPHNRLGLTMPGVSISEKVMFVRLLNHDNDSGAIGAGYAWDGKDVAWTELLADRFRIDLAALDRGARGLGSSGADRPRRGQ